MADKQLIIDLSTIDLENVIADIEEIRKCNPQRYEMEQLTAIVYEDLKENICIGYKDVTDKEFWIRGHMPGMPLMPGVVMCEAAAQMCSYYVQKHDLLQTKMIGFGGMEEIRFRGAVVPGNRLYVLCKLTKLRPRRMVISRFQGVVNGTLVVDGMIKGIPLPVDALTGASGDAS